MRPVLHRKLYHYVSDFQMIIWYLGKNCMEEANFTIFVQIPQQHLTSLPMCSWQHGWAPFFLPSKFPLRPTLAGNDRQPYLPDIILNNWVARLSLFTNRDRRQVCQIQVGELLKIWGWNLERTETSMGYIVSYIIHPPKHPFSKGDLCSL